MIYIIYPILYLILGGIFAGIMLYAQEEGVDREMHTWVITFIWPILIPIKFGLEIGKFIARKIK